MRLGDRPRPHDAARDAADDPAAVRDRVHVRSLVAPTPARRVLAEAAILVPAPGGSSRLTLEAMASGCAIADPPGVTEQPELAAAAVGRLVDDTAFRQRESALARARAEGESFDAVAAELERIYDGARAAATRGPLGRPARGPRLDPRRPAHAHALVA